MQGPPTSENEQERQSSLDRMMLVSTPREADLDRIARVARGTFDTEIALVSLVDRDRQWFKSRCGLNMAETPRDISFCGHAILQDGPFVVEDTLEDARFCDNPLVTNEPKIRFYAGQPLENRDGYRIGTLCVISSKARTFSDADRALLADLGRIAELVLEYRVLSETQIELLEKLSAAQRDTMIDPLTGLWNRRGLEEFFAHEGARGAREGMALGLAIVDIDHFKSINDKYGHAIGDDAIKLAAELLVDAMRASDLIARYGGEEFAALVPGTEADQLAAVGKKIVEIFRARARLDLPQAIHPFTVSCGLAAVYLSPENVFDSSSLLDRADRALYEAKSQGRDRFVVCGTA